MNDLLTLFLLIILAPIVLSAAYVLIGIIFTVFCSIGVILLAVLEGLGRLIKRLFNGKDNK